MVNLVKLSCCFLREIGKKVRKLYLFLREVQLKEYDSKNLLSPFSKIFINRKYIDVKLVSSRGLHTNSRSIARNKSVLESPAVIKCKRLSAVRVHMPFF